MSYDRPFGQDRDADARLRARAASTQAKIAKARKIAKEEGFNQALEPFGPDALKNIELALSACGEVLERVNDAVSAGDLDTVKALQPAMNSLLAENKRFLDRRFGSSVQRGKVDVQGRVTLSLGELASKHLAQSQIASLAAANADRPDIEDAVLVDDPDPPQLPPAAA